MCLLLVFITLSFGMDGKSFATSSGCILERRRPVACVPRFATVQFDGRAEETTILEVVVFRVAVDSDD